MHHSLSVVQLELAGNNAVFQCLSMLSFFIPAVL